MNVIEGSFITEDARIAIVASRFNEFITSKLISGAEDVLLRHDIDPEKIDLAWVPGAFEIPLDIVPPKPHPFWITRIRAAAGTGAYRSRRQAKTKCP